MGAVRDSAIMGAATFLVGAVFMEIGDDEGVEFDKTFPYIATFFSGAIGYYLLKKTNITDSFSAEEDIVSSYMKEAIGFMKRTGNTSFDWTDMKRKEFKNELLLEYDDAKKKAIKAAKEIKNKYMIENTYDSSYQAFWFRYKGIPYYMTWCDTDPTLYHVRDRLAQQRFKTIRRGGRKAKKNIQRKILMGAEERVKQEIINDEYYRDLKKFSYRGNEASYLYDADSKYGQLFFINSFKEARMGQGDSLPFAERIDEIKGKGILAKKVFKAFLDRLCESCDEPIYKHGIGNCFECSRDFDKEYKYEIDGFKDQNKNNFYSNMNRYCRKCLFYAGSFGDTNAPNDFDRKGANYSLGTARCDEHFNEMVEKNYPVEIAEGKKIPKHSLYDIENRNPQKALLEKRMRLRK
jgi:hypothetical protein